MYMISNTVIFILNAVGFLGYDFFYIYAIASGAKTLWHLGSISAILLGVTIAQMPLLGTIASIIGAMKAWDWGFFFSTYIFAVIPLAWIGFAALWYNSERAAIKIPSFLILLFLSSSFVWSIWGLRNDKANWVSCGPDNEGCQWYIDSESVTYDHKTEFANFRTKHTFSKTHQQRMIKIAPNEKEKELARQTSYDITDCILNYADNTYCLIQMILYASNGTPLLEIKRHSDWVPIKENSFMHKLSSPLIDIMLDKKIITVESFLFGKE